ncbi:MAG: LPS export ABC transporter periplasmic protein LptC [Azoarcus sp.]|jgi:lipopolysaccharide export system protein LptC|nr:LPS export ABC transporter periplasmic protein LptC [Azoarcus sp.]
MPGTQLAYRLYPVVIAALLALGSIWLERLTHEEDATRTDVDGSTPDFTADGVHVTGFAEDGALRYTLVSPHMTHVPDADQTQLEQPRLQLFTQGRRVWVSADSGIVGAKGTRVDFHGNVKAGRDGTSARESALNFFSAQLTVWPDEQRAMSNAPVKLVKDVSTITANTFSADNVFGLMKLSGKVHMTLPRKKRNS